MHYLANFIGTKALALKEKEINSKGPRYVRLVGRKSGLIDWLLNLCGIDTTTVLEIYNDRIEYKYSSLSGIMLEVIPLSKVSNLVCRYFKPIILLVIAIILFLWECFNSLTWGNFGPDFWILLFIALICRIYYLLKKSTLISIIPNSASNTSVAFKRSLIENLNITESEAKQIIKIVINLVENANSKSNINRTDIPTSSQTKNNNTVSNSTTQKENIYKKSKTNHQTITIKKFL